MIVIVFIACVFDYTSGFHDAVNSIATVVSTRVLSPQLAVLWAAFFNFVAFAILGTQVAKTIGGDLVHIELVAEDARLYMLLARLLGARAGGKLPDIPLWVVLSAHGAIALGTLSGGWRIVHTMGSKITKLKPVGGFCAETAGATALFAATLAGIPVSTQRLLAQSWAWEPTRRFSAVKWEVARVSCGHGY